MQEKSPHLNFHGHRAALFVIAYLYTGITHVKALTN